MSLLVPASRPYGQTYNFSGRPSTTWGTLVTASATPHSEGSLAEIVNSTTYDTDWIRILIHSVSTAATLTDALLNIYLGTTHLLIANLLAGWTAVPGASSPQGRRYEFPLFIPRGSQIQASLRALIASDTARVMVQLLNRNNAEWAGAGVESVGAVTASSRGTTVTPGTTSEGTFTSLGTTVRPFRYVDAGLMGNADTTGLGSLLGIDLGTGSSQIAGLENFLNHTTSAEDMADWYVSGRWRDVPAGTALEARLQSHTADAEAKSVIAYGVY